MRELWVDVHAKAPLTIFQMRETGKSVSRTSGSGSHECTCSERAQSDTIAVLRAVLLRSLHARFHVPLLAAHRQNQLAGNAL